VRQAAYFIHGRGRGHASRSFSVNRGLRTAGYTPTLHTGGDARDLLGSAGKRREPLRPNALAPLALLTRSATDSLRFGRARPDIVVSDGDQAAVLGAKVAGIPSLVVGHDLVFHPRVNTGFDECAELRFQRLNSLPMRAGSRLIAVHFLPASSDDPRISVARPDTLDGADFGPANERGPVLCYFRDPGGRDLARTLVARGHDVVLFSPDGQRETGIEARPFDRASFIEALKACRAVVATAGSNVIAECVTTARPLLALYRKSDSEQLLNATQVERARVGVSSEWADGEQRLHEFLSRVAARDFARVDLPAALPPLTSAVRRAANALAASYAAELDFAG
jgi:uncharacterized protein (TIGR00661 family)